MSTTLKQLKKAYADAVKKGDDEFVINGHDMCTEFTKYLIEYFGYYEFKDSTAIDQLWEII